MTDPHFGYIAASYAIAFVVITGLILWTALDQRAQRRALKALEARPVRRRAGDGRRP